MASLCPLLRRNLARLPIRQICQSQRWNSGAAMANKMESNKPIKDLPQKPVATERRRLQAQNKNHDSPERGLGPLPINAQPSQTINPTEGYFVERTPGRYLPVYSDRKRGGNLRLTKVRKISGNTQLLLKQLKEELSPPPEWIQLSPITGHIDMKGFYKNQIEQFLQAKGF